MDLPEFDNFQKWLNWFKTSPIYKFWLVLPIVLILWIGILHKENNFLRHKLSLIIAEITPIKELYPKLELSTAVVKLIEDYKILEIKINEIEKISKETVFDATPIVKEKQADGSYLYSFKLLPIGKNIIPILTIQCKTQNQAPIEEIKVHGPTVPLISTDRTSEDKTFMRREFRSLYPGEVSVNVMTGKDAGDINVGINPLNKSNEMDS
jgi:hypothetical protein